MRSEAKGKARELLDREARISMSAHDFKAFTKALKGEFTPNAALQTAMSAARKVQPHGGTIA